jgi:hypothetical protein
MAFDPEDEKPIVSLLADDPSERPRIEAFVLGLSDSVDNLQDHEQGGDYGSIVERSRNLSREALGYGFPLLAESGQVVLAAALNRDAERTREAILLFTEVARRVRLGHRGAPPPGL